MVIDNLWDVTTKWVKSSCTPDQFEIFTKMCRKSWFDENEILGVLKS